MDYTILTRKKDKGIQAVISYKFDSEKKWKQKTKQGFEKEKDAKRWATDYVDELKKQEKELLKSKNLNNDITLKEAILIYLDFKKTRVSFNTYNNTKSFLKTLEPFENLELNKMTIRDFQNIIDFSPSSRKCYIGAFFNYLNKMEFININKFIYKKHNKNKKISIISDSKYNEIINSNLSEEVKMWVKLAYLYGMRCGEILGLSKDTVFVDKIVVDKQWNSIDSSMYGFCELKNRENGKRILPSNKEIYNELCSLPYNHNENRFFTINTSSYIRTKLQKFNINPHDFRHTKATIMVNQNFNLKYIAYFLGDKLDTIVQNYVKLSNDIIYEQNLKFFAEFLPNE